MVQNLIVWYVNDWYWLKRLYHLLEPWKLSIVQLPKIYFSLLFSLMNKRSKGQIVKRPHWIVFRLVTITLQRFFSDHKCKRICHWNKLGKIIHINPLVPMTRRCSSFFVFFYYFSVNHKYATKTPVPFWCLQLICQK